MGEGWGEGLGDLAPGIRSTRPALPRFKSDLRTRARGRLIVGVSRERFEQGLTYEQWKAQMTRNRERHDANETGLPLSEADLAPFKSLPKKVNVLMLAEDWCGDVIANTPIVGRIASEVDTLNLKVFLRDKNEDLMDQFLKE